MHDRRDRRIKSSGYGDGHVRSGRGRPESVWIENRGHVRRNGYNERVIREPVDALLPDGRLADPACGIAAPGSSKERARRRVGVIILGADRRSHVSGSRNTVNPLACPRNDTTGFESCMLFLDPAKKLQVIAQGIHLRTPAEEAGTGRNQRNTLVWAILGQYSGRHSSALSPGANVCSGNRGAGNRCSR